MSESKKPKHILLATTGESSQVVTETLYAIHQKGEAWPDEIRIITTLFGKARAEKGLLHEGHLERLCKEINRALPNFNSELIRVVRDANNQEVDDARTLEDHEALADFIMSEVRDLTITDKQGQPKNIIHASLAGGRKTMTFYLGYAMSLFGRQEDQLTHVLISKGFESNPNFWFPTQDPEYRHLQDRDKNSLDASTATVTLAKIPFIRHRQELPAYLKRKATKEKEKVNFKQLVELVNLGNQPNNLRIQLDLSAGKVKVTDKKEELEYVEIEPSKLDLAFYAMMIRSTKEQEPDLNRPQQGKPSIGLTRLFLDELLQIFGLCSTADIKADIRCLKEWHESDAAGSKAHFKESTLKSIENGMKDTWFDQRRNSLKTCFEEYLPPAVCKHLLPEIIWTEDGKLLRNKPAPLTPEEKKARKQEKNLVENAPESKKRRRPSKREIVEKQQQEQSEKFIKKGGGYGIPLDSANIQLHDSRS